MAICRSLRSASSRRLAASSSSLASARRPSSMPKRPAYRFEGRVLPPGSRASERELHHNEFTENQMKMIDLEGLPIVCDHSSEGGFRVGRVERSWLDGEGWLRISGAIDTRTLSGRAAAAQVERGTREGLSLTHIYEPYERIGREPGWFESKTFKEVAVLPRDRIEREGCLALTGEHVEIEGQDRITEPAEAERRPTARMDPKEKASYELELQQAREKRDALAKDLEKFTAGARAQDEKMVALEASAKERDSREDGLKKQLDGFFQRDRAQLDAKHQELAGLLPTTADSQKVLEDAKTLATDPAGVEKMQALFTLVADNMRVETREEQEALVQGYKHQMAGAASTEQLVAENRKRYRTEGGGGAPAGSVTTSARNLAILEKIERDMAGR